MAIYAGGAVFALWLTGTVIGAINNIPLVSSEPHQQSTHTLRARRKYGFVVLPPLRQCQRDECACVLRDLSQLPKLLELVGLGYSAWFTYRYLLFKVRAVVEQCALLAPGIVVPVAAVRPLGHGRQCQQPWC